MNSEVPNGSEFLKAVRDMEKRCEGKFYEWVTVSEEETSRTLNALGRAFSYLDQVSSCLWGCRGGDHVVEYMIGRAVSNGLASIRLLGAGYYDEALGLIRQMGENANLLCLFMQSQDALERWQTAEEKVRRNDFSPVEVRRQLEQRDMPMPMNRDLYELLSGLSVHINPDTKPQLHNPFNQPTLGGYFQITGAIVALNHLADMTSYILGISSTLIEDRTARDVLIETMTELWESISDLDLFAVPGRWTGVHNHPQFEQVAAGLRWRHAQIRSEFSKHVENQSTPDSPH